MMTYGGGMVAELNNARTRGEWGRFGVYTIAGLFVIVVIIFAGWWGASYLANALSSCGDWHLKHSNAKSCDTTRP